MFPLYLWSSFHEGQDIDEWSWFASSLTLLDRQFDLIITSTNILSTYYVPGIITSTLHVLVHLVISASCEVGDITVIFWIMGEKFEAQPSCVRLYIK